MKIQKQPRMLELIANQFVALFVWFSLITLGSCFGAETGSWWVKEPHFGNSGNAVVVSEGSTARLPCIVLNLNDRSVTWMRKRDLHILTVDHITYSADDRFEAYHKVGSDEWTLLVHYVQQRDTGTYECQVNTDPKISKPITLSIMGSDIGMPGSKTNVFVANNTASTKDGNLRVEIIGPRERFIEEGSQLTLTCVITSLTEPSTVVYWYHGNTLIDYNSPRGGVNLKVNNPAGETITTLAVSSVGPGDTGMYSCVPPGSHPATVLVHVQKEEQKAAIHQSGVSNEADSESSSRGGTNVHFNFNLQLLLSLITFIVYFQRRETFRKYYVVI